MLGAPALLTTSCTSALEMAMLLLDLQPGDEVIMPSYTFTSTANAVVLRRAVPVFVDVRPDTLNIDEELIERAITPRTRAICVVHYAGVGCEMDRINAIAAAHGLPVVEDAAQALFASWRGRPLGTFGTFAAFSFHATKNIIAGEGGALVVNDPTRLERAEIAWEKGTDRMRFQRGEVSKYRWVDVGSSFVPSELNAAFLLAQLECGEAATLRRLGLWHRYHDAFADLEAAGRLMRPSPPPHCEHNGHIYFLLAPDAETRDRWLAGFASEAIGAVVHYVPLHSSPAGLRFGRTDGPLPVTDDISSRLVRLPLHLHLDEADQDRVIDMVRRLCGD
jgi:dTDP-4-amino-4,6-dideoxygalactose transaminase